MMVLFKPYGAPTQAVYQELHAESILVHRAQFCRAHKT